jgi:hypothetical protein
LFLDSKIRATASRRRRDSMGDELWIKRGEGRTLSVNVRFFTDAIATGGEGYVKPGHAWFKGDVGFRPNKPHGVRSIGTEPIMFNRPEDLLNAILQAAKAQGITLLRPGTGERLT